jgi:hypothetical protein
MWKDYIEKDHEEVWWEVWRRQDFSKSGEPEYFLQTYFQAI